MSNGWAWYYSDGVWWWLYIEHDASWSGDPRREQAAPPGFLWEDGSVVWVPYDDLASLNLDPFVFGRVIFNQHDGPGDLGGLFMWVPNNP